MREANETEKREEDRGKEKKGEEERREESRWGKKEVRIKWSYMGKEGAGEVK